MTAPGNPPPFAFGQKVYVAHADSWQQSTVPCPMCAGKLFVTLILGSGEQTPVECDFCGHGYEGPRGVATVHGPASSVREVVVTGMVDEGAGDWRVEGYCVHERLREGNVFATREEAEARAAVLFVEAEAQAQRNFESQFEHKKKSLTWTVGYHRNQIKSIERQLEWHRAKLAEPKMVKAAEKVTP